MKLLHLLGFTKELVFGFSTSVTRFNLFFVCFSMVLAFFKEPAGIVCHTFVAFSIQRLHFIRVTNDKFYSCQLFFRVTEFAHFLRLFSRFYPHF